MADGDRSSELAAVIGVFLPLSFLAVCLRSYVRIFISKSFGPDDWALVIGMIMFILYNTMAIMGIVYGTGKHITDIPADQLPLGLMYWWLCEPFYDLSAFFVRLSVGLFLHRLCVTPLQHKAVYLLMAIISVFSLIYFFIVIFQCYPPMFFWSRYGGDTNGTCHPIGLLEYSSMAHSVILALTDWAFGLLPIWMIWNVQMAVRLKIIVIILLCLGMVAGIGAIIRIPYIHTIAVTDDFLYATVDVAVWSTIEPGLGFLAASAAALRPLFRRFLGDASTRGRTGGSTAKPTSRSLPFHGPSKSNTVINDTELEGYRTNQATAARNQDNWSFTEHGMNGLHVADTSSSQESLHMRKEEDPHAFSRSPKHYSIIGPNE